ncbi:MAG TPA: prepilin peptidase [bacterium]|nr:prepilin peptidase [bacterium]
MIAVVIILGLVFGSFLNVVIYRLPRNESLVRPGSHCPGCGRPVRWYDNIPVIGFIILRGECRHCGEPISWQYPAVEIITAVLAAALYLRYGLSAHFLAYTVLSLFLIPISVIDIQKGLILNKLTLPGFILGVPLILCLQIEHWQSILIASVGGGVVLLLFAYLGKLMFRKESLGMGDVKLIVLIGVYLGFPAVMLALFLGAFTAMIFIAGGMIFKQIKVGSTIPFGPFIALGTLGYLLWGEAIIRWYIWMI